MVRQGRGAGQTAQRSGSSGDTLRGRRRFARTHSAGNSGPNAQRGGSPEVRRPAPHGAATRGVRRGEKSAIRSDVDAEAVLQFLELVAVDVVGRVEMLGLGDELQGVVAAEAEVLEDLLERLQIVGVDE